MRKLIALVDFLFPLTNEEDELQISNCNWISKLKCSPPSDSEDLNGEWVPPTMLPPMDDDDYQDNGPKLDLDEEDYLSDEVLSENDFIIDPFFYQENILDIEVQIYNPRLLEPGGWLVNPPSFPVPSEIHPDPLPILDDDESRCRGTCNCTYSKGHF